MSLPPHKTNVNIENYNLNCLDDVSSWLTDWIVFLNETGSIVSQ